MELVTAPFGTDFPPTALGLDVFDVLKFNAHACIGRPTKRVVGGSRLDPTDSFSITGRFLPNRFILLTTFVVLEVGHGPYHILYTRRARQADRPAVLIIVHCT